MDKKIYLKIVYMLPLIVLSSTFLLSTVYAGNKNNNTSYEQVSNQASEFYEAIKKYSIDQKDKAVTEAEQTLDYLDNRIEKLEDKSEKRWNKLSNQGREQLQENLKNLRKQRTEVAEWYGGMKQSTKESWDYLKSGFMKSYKIMSDTWHNIENEYSNDEEND